ncbi:hypothetical protein [Alteromonas sp. 009811495]|uniref:hypothetical protein n=1 Tax=Alteromonas sp. 009811495 TaxID=3002962 RepID=UPI00237E234E|nr:hypothetical protein [Alteromonas sp. 009811495]WDT84409.1 hypothetical protein OZ660_10705 [Alteromonas sp. 009811495]
MKKIALNFVILALSVLLAYFCLESTGNNEEYFSRRNSPTTILIISLVAASWSAFSVATNLFSVFLPESNWLNTELAELLRLSKGRQPYLKAVGYVFLGAFIIFASAPFMDDSDSLFTNQYLALAGVLMVGVVCFIWGLLIAFLTSIRLPDED